MIKMLIMGSLYGASLGAIVNAWIVPNLSCYLRVYYSVLGVLLLLCGGYLYKKWFLSNPRKK